MSGIRWPNVVSFLPLALTPTYSRAGAGGCKGVSACLGQVIAGKEVLALLPERITPRAGDSFPSQGLLFSINEVFRNRAHIRR